MPLSPRNVGLLVLGLLIAAALVDNDSISIALSIAGLAIAVVALVLIFLARRAARTDESDT
jgi:membrane protein implicated in regulation of membrane protease activity